MDNEKDEIFALISPFYNKNIKKINKWYETPHSFICSCTKRSPKDLVKSGNGEKVIAWLKLALNK